MTGINSLTEMEQALTKLDAKYLGSVSGKIESLQDGISALNQRINDRSLKGRGPQLGSSGPWVGPFSSTSACTASERLTRMTINTK